MRRGVLLVVIGGLAYAADLLDPQVKEVTRPANERIALLIGAGKYQDPNWDLANSTADLATMGDTLALGADIAPAFQLQLRGTDVTVRGVQKAVKEAAARLAAPAAGGEGLLVVYWSGHAFTDHEGRQVYFTANTEPGEPVDGVPTYTDTISRDALLGWIGDARAERTAAGIRFRTVIVNDVCRIVVKAPPRTALFRPESAWEWFGTAAGDYSLASQRSDAASAFTAQLRVVLPQQAKLGVLQPLADTAKLVASAMQGQKPELKSPEGMTESPGLVRAIKVRPFIRLVDAFSGAPLARGTISADGAEPVAIEVDAQVALNPGPVRRLRAEAPGYLPNEIDVQARSDALSGRALVIPLHPSVVVVRGSVAAGRMRARAVNVLADLREDTHRIVTETDAEGSFELVLPRIEAGIKVQVAGREFAIPGDPAAWPAASFRGRLLVPTFRIEEGRPIVPAGAVQPLASVPVPPAAVPATGVEPAAIVQESASMTVPPAPVVAPLAGARLASAAGQSTPAVPGIWPLAARSAGTALSRQADGSFDLTGLGSAVGTCPARFDASARLGLTVDLGNSGTAPGQALTPPAVPVARKRQIAECSALGTPVGFAPNPPSVQVVRQKRIVELSASGTFAGYAPLPPTDPVERAVAIVDVSAFGTPEGLMPEATTVDLPRQESVVDLAGDGADPDAYAIPEALAKSLAAAIPGAP